ncbi:predicted protein [Histoplasma capsulatum var. duboisii H88]|uniref:Predicted protein n=2 Tax=Ajellomyces capsulatus TaxID=5037 RepID=F0UAQ7_AJEC8|nr:predicted protein [Histoplasma capsulatum H143]EGC42923.1 predicted protein [Histoplasma capsulatum var. duboisii H88]QSS49113.1 hypothetical protein I7I53_09381 [Histoplasma capsulatum var. duboisii H88]
MCNGSSARTSKGGATVFLRPVNSEESNGPVDYQITLQEHRSAEAEGIHFSIKRPANGPLEQEQTRPCPVEAFRDCWVEIHPDGDLTPSQHRDRVPPLHRFPLQNLTRWEDLEDISPTTLASMKLIPDQNNLGSVNWKLRLDACETGVIGRRMSIVSATGLRVAEGVIGWN